MTRNLTHAFSRKSVSLFVSSRPHPQSPSPALRPGRSTRPTATRRRSRRRRPPPPFVFRPVAVPAAALPFCLERLGLGRVRRRGGFRGGGGLGRLTRGRAPPGRRGRAGTIPSPLPANTRVRQPPLRGRGGAEAASRLGLLLQPAERAGPVLLHLVLVHVPSPDSDGLAHGPVRARRGLDDALGDVLAESGGHRARGRPTRRSRGVRHRGGARRSAPRERDVLRGRDARVDVRARSRRALARRGRFLSWFCRGSRGDPFLLTDMRRGVFRFPQAY